MQTSSLSSRSLREKLLQKQEDPVRTPTFQSCHWDIRWDARFKFRNRCARRPIHLSVRCSTRFTMAADAGVEERAAAAPSDKATLCKNLAADGPGSSWRLWLPGAIHVLGMLLVVRRQGYIRGVLLLPQGQKHPDSSFRRPPSTGLVGSFE